MELDSDDEGYFLPRKRRRVTENSEVSSPYVHRRSYRRKNPIMHMPTEILQRIFGYMSNDDLASSLRLVNHRFRAIVQSILNLNFKKLKYRMETLRKMIVDSIRRIEDDLETKRMCIMLSTLEILSFYHSLISSTLWRYVHFQASRSNLCMYAGSILDMYRTVLRQFVTQPHRIYLAAFLHDYALSEEVKAICNNTKAFVLYFDRISELPINNNSFCNGSKILDLLDCATDSNRTVVFQKLTKNTLTLKLRYYFTSAWFVALDIPEEESEPWNEQQRLMYMQLREIVINHSEMTMKYNQYRREVLRRTNPVSRIMRPIDSVYTGYGEMGNKLFFYGVMNEGAYFNEFENDDMRQHFHDQPTNRISFLGIYVSVELECPLQLAPYAVLEGYMKQHDFQDRPILTPHRKIRGIFDLKIDFECLAARYSRLPTTFTYNLRFRR